MNYAVEQRLVFIDFLLSHYGNVTRSALTEYFGIGEATATRDLKLYQKSAPNNSVFNQSDKAYYKTTCFKRLYG